MPKTHNRLDSRLFTVRHAIRDLAGEVTGEHVFEMQVSHNEQGQPVEVAFAGRGKIGHGIDLLFVDVGLWVSRVLQNRDPETGEELRDE